MELRCPYCGQVDGLAATHRHLVEAHLEQVTTEQDEDTGQMAFVVLCPFCELDYRRLVKPRNRNPRFLEEFKAEIALVAFDQMIYHLLADHPDEVGLDSDGA